MLEQPPESFAIDSRRIDIIRMKLDEDSYFINSRQIADRIIDIELALSERSMPPPG